MPRERVLTIAAKVTVPALSSSGGQALRLPTDVLIIREAPGGGEGGDCGLKQPEQTGSLLRTCSSPKPRFRSPKKPKQALGFDIKQGSAS